VGWRSDGEGRLFELPSFSEGVKEADDNVSVWMGDVKPDGIPVVYIPGNAGSMMQARSIASSASRQYWRQPFVRDPKLESIGVVKPLDVFTGTRVCPLSRVKAAAELLRGSFVQSTSTKPSLLSTARPYSHNRPTSPKQSHTSSLSTPTSLHHPAQLPSSSWATPWAASSRDTPSLSYFLPPPPLSSKRFLPSPPHINSLQSPLTQQQTPSTPPSSLTGPSPTLTTLPIPFPRPSLSPFAAARRTLRSHLMHVLFLPT
jgi:hypothetical protein